MSNNVDTFPSLQNMNFQRETESYTMDFLNSLKNLYLFSRIKDFFRNTSNFVKLVERRNLCGKI